MADERVPDDDCSDSSFVENSQSEAETGEEDWQDMEDTNVKVTRGRAKSCSGVVADVMQSPANKENKDTSAPTGQKKRKQSVLGGTGGRKSKKARNTTYASKIECLDSTEIREFVLNPPPCCKKKCLTKLKIFTDRAIKAINDIRVSRFQGWRTCGIAISDID